MTADWFLVTGAHQECGQGYVQLPFTSNAVLRSDPVKAAITEVLWML